MRSIYLKYTINYQSHYHLKIKVVIHMHIDKIIASKLTKNYILYSYILKTFFTINLIFNDNKYLSQFQHI